MHVPDGMTSGLNNGLYLDAWILFQLITECWVDAAKALSHE